MQEVLWIVQALFWAYTFLDIELVCALSDYKR